MKGPVEMDHDANDFYAHGVRGNGDARSQGFRNVYLVRGASDATSSFGNSVQSVRRALA